MQPTGRRSDTNLEDIVGQRNEDAQRQVKEIISKLKRQGWEVTERRRGYKAMPPQDPATGERRGGPVFFHPTPSDWRSIKNLRAVLRRHGADL